MTRPLPKRWYHGGSAEDAEQVRALGFFPEGYAPVRANWGRGVYLTSNKQEATTFGEEVLTCTTSARLLDMRNPQYREMPSGVFNHVSQRGREAFERAYNAGTLGEASREAALADGYDGIVWTGDNWHEWAVVFRPELVTLFRRSAAVRKNPATPETAASLLDSIALDSKGRVKGSAEELVRWLKAAIADSLPPGGEIDRYGNFLWSAPRKDGSQGRYRYHFTAQRVQFQVRAHDEWVTHESRTFKDMAQRVYANLAKLAGREEAREQAKAGAKVRKEAKAQAQAKLAQRRQKNSEQGLRGIQIEVEHPELVRRLVLEQDLQAGEELRPLLAAVSPAASSQPPPRGFYLAPFALPVDKAPSMAWTAQLPSGESVSVAQVPVKNERTRMVTSCDLHIGRAGDFGLMVSPRKHSVSFSPGLAGKGQGPGYLSATWDLEMLDVSEGARIRSELFFVIAHEKRRGVGRELVRLWLEAARMVTGGGKRMDLRIVSIVDAAWPFWLQLAKEGLYEVLQATPTSLRVR